MLNQVWTLFVKTFWKYLAAYIYTCGTVQGAAKSICLRIKMKIIFECSISYFTRVVYTLFGELASSFFLLSQSWP